jgi:hypothetical protein
MEFYSNCFIGTVHTDVSSSWRDEAEWTWTHPVWHPEVITIADTILAQKAFLEEQHLFVMLRTQDRDEACGEEVQ